MLFRSTDQAGLTNLAREIRQQGVSVSSIGVGTDFNEDLMQAIAELGSGAYGYLADASQLASIFQKDLQQAGTTIARDVRLSFELPEGVELGDVLGYRSSQVGRTVSVPMTDFSAGQVERLVARLTVNAPQAGRSFDVTRLQLQYSDLLKNAPVETSLNLSAMTTDDRSEVLARRDKDATVYAARAQSAWNMNQAAESVKQGDRQKANEYMQKNMALFGEAAQVAGPAAVASDLKAQEAINDDFQNARGAEAVQNAAKGAKRKARQDFGLMGSTY